MFSTLINDFEFQLILLILSIASLINCECGLPAIPKNAKIDRFEFVYSENSQIEYYCELPELVLLNGTTRTCQNGRWLGSIPFCAEEIGENSITRIEISDSTGKKENHSIPIKSTNGRAFVGDSTRRECIGSRGGALKPVIYQLFLHRKYPHISYFEVVIQTKSAVNSEILIESVLNPWRACTATVVEPSVAPSYLMRLKFMCDIVANTDDETKDAYYSHDFTENITLKFDTSSVSICEVRLFYRKFNSAHSCGSPDIPVHSSVDLVQYGSKYGSMPYYHYSCDNNYQLVGSPEVRCGVNNYWLDEFPGCVPKVTCPLPPERDIKDWLTTNNLYFNLSEFNGGYVATPGSQVIYSCDESENITKVMIGDSIRVCTETGKWTGIQPYCMPLNELKMDKYSEILEQNRSIAANLEINSQIETTDCGFPALPMYAKPAPSSWMSEDFRTHYPNRTKINYRCESLFHIMYPLTKTRVCVNRKWTGNGGRCEINHGGGLILTSIQVLSSGRRRNRIISEWLRPERNETTATEKTFRYYYDENAFGNWGGSRSGCASFNVTDKQKWVLSLNDTKHISSFYLNIRPGGMYGGFNNFVKTKNYTLRPLIAKVGRTVCYTSAIYDSVPRSSHIAFNCDDSNSIGDFSSNSVNEIILYVNPTQFDKKFDSENVSLCSLTLFHASESCGTPDRPLNSFVKIENQIAYYSCEAGYELMGPKEVQCLPNGMWAQDFPVCKLKLNMCQSFTTVGIITQLTYLSKDSHIILGSLVISKCTQPLLGFIGQPILVGSRIRICQSDGQWSGTTPYCIDSSKIQSDKAQSYTLSTKALVVIISVSITTVIVTVLIILVICCHLTQKCVQCCSFCWKRCSKVDKTNDNIITITVRPESQINITEINETLQKLAYFQPLQERETENECEIQQGENSNVSFA